MDDLTRLRDEIVLTDKDIAALLEARRIFTMLDGAAICSGRYTRKRTLERLLRAGLVEKIDNCIKVDDDGYMVEPERIGVGYRITPRGLRLIEQTWQDERAKNEVKQGPYR